MRISDWSSDVCSSDLDGGHHRHRRGVNRLYDRYEIGLFPAFRRTEFGDVRPSRKGERSPDKDGCHDIFIEVDLGNGVHNGASQRVRKAIYRRIVQGNDGNAVMYCKRTGHQMFHIEIVQEGDTAALLNRTDRGDLVALEFRLADRSEEHTS